MENGRKANINVFSDILMLVLRELNEREISRGSKGGSALNAIW